MRSILFTGTGTDVGKTYCAARWIEMRHQRGERIAVYKPVASGCVSVENPQAADPANPDTRIAEDAQQLWEACGGVQAWPDLGLSQVCPQQYLAPLSPPMAAKAEGRSVNDSQLLAGIDTWQATNPDWLVIEGAGGLFSPLSDQWLNIDFVKQVKRQLPDLRVVVVTINRLGVIHDTLACLRAAEAAGVTVDAVWLNSRQEVCDTPDESTGSNRSQIAHWGVSPVAQSAEDLSDLLA